MSLHYTRVNDKVSHLHLTFSSVAFRGGLHVVPVTVCLDRTVIRHVLMNGRPLKLFVKAPAYETCKRGGLE